MVGGEAGVYAGNSSICVAAIHSGLLSRGGDVTIRIFPAPSEFEGSDRNGIVSSSYFGHENLGAFVVEGVAKQCPMDAHPLSSFLALSTTSSLDPVVNAESPQLDTPMKPATQQTDAAHPRAGNVFTTQASLPTAKTAGVAEEVNEATTIAINHLSIILSQQLGGLNEEVMEHVKVDVSKVSS